MKMPWYLKQERVEVKDNTVIVYFKINRLWLYFTLTKLIAIKICQTIHQ